MSPMKQCGTSLKVVRLAIHLRNNARIIDQVKKIGSHMPFGFLRSALADYKKRIVLTSLVQNVARKLGNPRRVLAGEKRTRWLRPEQKPYSLLKKPVSCFSQPGDLAVALFTGKFSAAVTWLLAPRHRVLVRSEQDPVYFRLASDVFRDSSKEQLHYWIGLESQRGGRRGSQGGGRALAERGVCWSAVVSAGRTVAVLLL